MEQTVIHLKRIPEYMRGISNWVTWTIEIRDGKPAKIPLDPKSKGKNAKSNDPSTWGTFNQAVKHYQENIQFVKGIGFMLGNSMLIGIDLDKCRNPETGLVEQWAIEIINEINSYTEISPSGQGIHIVAYGKLPQDSTRRRNKRIEIYDSGRFFTVTGNPLPNTPPEIKDRQKILTGFYWKHFPKEEQALVSPIAENHPSTLTDSEIIEKASQAENGEKFKRLFFEGDISSYQSPSEADHALCSIIDFWTQDTEQKERLLRQSALNREKWDSHKTYLDRTIKSAISTEHFTPTEHEPSKIMEQKKDITSEVRIWLDGCTGNFSLSQIYTDLCITTRQERNLAQQELSRAVKRGQIERLRKYGEYRKIEKGRERMKCPTIEPRPLNIKFPDGLEEYLSLLRGSIMIIGGSPNSGKTAYQFNTARLNMNRFKVKYISSEMNEDEIYVRLKCFTDFTHEDIEEMFDKITFVKCTSEFQDEIEPDALNIVDYLEIPDGEFYKVQDQIRKIYDKLNDGVAIIGIQKNRGADLPKGGTGAIEKARIAITIENNIVTVVKGKIWKNGYNPHGLTRRFWLPGGINFKWDIWQEGGQATPGGAS